MIRAKKWKRGFIDLSRFRDIGDSTKFSILLAVCLEQDLGRERVKERETEVMIEEVEASLEEVDAMSRKFSLSWKTLFGKELEANFYHTILVGKQIRL